MRAFWRAAISEEHANGVGEIILWCHYTGSRGHHTPHLLGNGHRGKVKVWQLDVRRDPPRLIAGEELTRRRNLAIVGRVHGCVPRSTDHASPDV